MLVESKEEEANPDRIRERIIGCLGRTVSLVAKVAAQIEYLKLMMKEFWTAA